MGWKKIVYLLEANAIRHKRKRDEEIRWINMMQCWMAYNNFFNLIRDTNNCNIESIKYCVNTIKNSIIMLKWKFTPWMHILCYHYVFFENQNVRPILLSCFGPEGHHRKLKRDFNFSLHSTRRYNTQKSGLMDVLCHDNILISLISKGIYPWNNLKLPLGNPIKEPKRGYFLNFFKIKYPIPFDNFNEGDDDNGEISNSELQDNSDYNPDDTSGTES